MRRKIIQDVSASTTQVIVNQALGLFIFLVTSRFLPKEIYGEFNWSIAILTFITSILSLRLEQIVVRRIAAGEDASRMLSLFTVHILFTGTIFFLVLIGSGFLFPGFFQQHQLLLFLAISHILSFFASPFRQLANGKENFRVLAWMSSISNIIRVTGLLILILNKSLTIWSVIIVFIISSVIELITCFLLSHVVLKTPLRNIYNARDYYLLIVQSLPQAGMVFLHASIARIDWILLGIISTSFITAEYSFAYKVYELSPFPLLIIAPILLSRFSRFISKEEENALQSRQLQIAQLVRFEMVAATFIPLILNLVWTPLVDDLTNGKYGAVNESTFFLLSCCLPFLYLNNLIWTAHFAADRLRLLLRITLVTFLIILCGDLLLIPGWGARGAAAVYLFAMLIEYLHYMSTSGLRKIRETWFSLIICSGIALLTGFAAYYITASPYLRLGIAIPAYLLLILATRQLRISDFREVARLLQRKPVTAPVANTGI